MIFYFEPEWLNPLNVPLGRFENIEDEIANVDVEEHALFHSRVDAGAYWMANPTPRFRVVKIMIDHRHVELVGQDRSSLEEGLGLREG